MMLSAYDEKTENWRIERLRLVQARYTSVLLALGREDWEGCGGGLMQLHDHKGTLTARWITEEARDECVRVRGGARRQH